MGPEGQGPGMSRGKGGQQPQAHANATPAQRAPLLWSVMQRAAAETAVHRLFQRRAVQAAS
eukprot:CAMPEP_0174364058 /NCGR_PEP_ID=MMETSP0811_2-20130205/71335_1 /TAXON_ID=73025 ORGANISM="Eutreptiella gymnastica-like, Strain CCMP1594" /NCGR_SAMPLE_ID=MMETSP0811_2 /ASSEMBLY_ACC=CAM_ASM_000667 /LENGTH=60 /DNA_ID=CAMNT_0015503355 /DNA_START=96 /DNA_END=278 /DNA_ORIENTATION=+